MTQHLYLFTLSSSRACDMKSRGTDSPAYHRWTVCPLMTTIAVFWRGRGFRWFHEIVRLGYLSKRAQFNVCATVDVPCRHQSTFIRCEFRASPCKAIRFQFSRSRVLAKVGYQCKPLSAFVSSSYRRDHPSIRPYEGGSFLSRFERTIGPPKLHSANIDNHPSPWPE